MLFLPKILLCKFLVTEKIGLITSHCIPYLGVVVEGRAGGAHLNGNVGSGLLGGGVGWQVALSEDLLSLPWQIPALLGQL